MHNFLQPHKDQDCTLDLYIEETLQPGASQKVLIEMLKNEAVSYHLTLTSLLSHPSALHNFPNVSNGALQ